MKTTKMQCLVMFVFVLLHTHANCQVKVMPDGTVNIGSTANPMHDLQVTGGALVTTCTSNFCGNSCAYIRGNNGYSTASNPDYTWWYDDITGFMHPLQGNLGIVTGGFERIRIDGNGRVGIGTATPSASFRLDLIGSARCSGIWQNSDKRFKLNVRRIEGALSRITLLSGVSYDMDTVTFPEYGFNKGKTLGFIAQDLKEVVPEAVIVDEKGYHAVNYDMVIPLLVEAVKEQQQQIAALSNELANCCAQEVDANGKLRLGTGAITGSEMVRLYQNAPNPYTERTSIGCYVSNEINSAHIVIYSATGDRVREIPVVGRGETRVEFHAGDLQAGMYFYALYADDVITPALQMLLTKN